MQNERRIATVSSREVNQILPAEGWVVARMVLGQEVVEIARLIAWGLAGDRFERAVAGLVAEPLVGVSRVADSQCPGGTTLMAARSFIGYFPSGEAAVHYISQTEEMRGWTVIGCDGDSIDVPWPKAQASIPALGLEEGGRE